MSGSSNQNTLIICDPSPLSLVSIAGVFDIAGYRCICARQLDQLKELTEFGPADALLIDVGDQPRESLAAIDELRSQPDQEDLPAVVMADSRWNSLISRVATAEICTRILFKPVDLAVLQAVVNDVVMASTAANLPGRASEQATVPAPKLGTRPSNESKRGSRRARAEWVRLDG